MDKPHLLPALVTTPVKGTVGYPTWPATSDDAEADPVTEKGRGHLTESVRLTEISPGFLNTEHPCCVAFQRRKHLPPDHVPCMPFRSVNGVRDYRRCVSPVAAETCRSFRRTLLSETPCRGQALRWRRGFFARFVDSEACSGRIRAHTPGPTDGMCDFSCGTESNSRREAGTRLSICGKCLRDLSGRARVVEPIGLIAAVLGVVAAVLNRKRIVIHRYEDTAYSSAASSRSGPSRSPAKIGKRFKRLGICLGLAFMCACAGASTQDSNGALSNFLALPFFVCFLLAAYQSVAIVIMVLFRLWR